MRRGVSLAGRRLEGALSALVESVSPCQSALTPGMVRAACKPASSYQPVAVGVRQNSALPEIVSSKHEAEPEQHFTISAPRHGFAHDTTASEAAHARRLSEMQHAARSQKGPRPRLQLPTAEEAQERLKSNSSASCSGQNPQDGPVLHWREAVEGLRLQNQQTNLTGREMLTDTFGCADTPELMRCLIIMC